jgi:hypothetical protein
VHERTRCNADFAVVGRGGDSLHRVLLSPHDDTERVAMITTLIVALYTSTTVYMLYEWPMTSEWQIPLYLGAAFAITSMITILVWLMVEILIQSLRRGRQSQIQ